MISPAAAGAAVNPKVRIAIASWRILVFMRDLRCDEEPAVGASFPNDEIIPDNASRRIPGV